MGNFVLRSKIDTILGSKPKKPILEIEFLGTGGAFNPAEKNSSAIIKTQFGNILIDCGSTVYAELKKENLVDDLTHVFITHFHEDHMGSLTTLLYDRYTFLGKSTQIECTPSVALELENYFNLFEARDNFVQIKDTYSLNTTMENKVFDDINMKIYKIDTSKFHSTLSSCGFVFNFKKNGEDIYIVYSGDINVPFTEIIETENPGLYHNMLKTKENVFIFHEATAYEYEPSPHCLYTKLIPVQETFPNIFTYHHGKEEAKVIIEHSGLPSLSQSHAVFVLEEKKGF